MFIDFFLKLRDAQVPCSLREYLTLVEAVDGGYAEFAEPRQIRPRIRPGL